MLANMLYFAYVVFLTVFIAMVIIGHVLLLHAILPDLLPKKREPRKLSRDSVQDAAAATPLSKTTAPRSWPSWRNLPGRRATAVRVARS
jgi:hypothetical protein